MVLPTLQTAKFSVLGADASEVQLIRQRTSKGDGSIRAAPASLSVASNTASKPPAQPTSTASAAAVDPHQSNVTPKSQKATTTTTAATAKAAPPPPRPWTAKLQADYENILSVGEECVAPDELRALLLAKGRGSPTKNQGFILYDGFEPSGRMHIAQGVFKAVNVNKCTTAGGTFVFWVADWFALMNDKMGGDLDKIQTVGHYLQQVWKAAGMDLTHVIFKWASHEITTQAATYWPIMLDVASRFNVTRIKKCCQIMGRLEGNLTAAQILYPLMQCTDVFFLHADICQLGVDQRKVNMLAREYCDAAGITHKPIILSHHMLYGLKAGQEKMSKSDPDSAVFMEDTPEDVERKIMHAYCPATTTVDEHPNAHTTTTTTTPTDVDDAGRESMHLKVDTLKNPCLDYTQHIIFAPPGATFTAGDGTTFDRYDDVRAAFLNGSLSETHLKRGLINELNRLIDPVRHHFTHDAQAQQLLERVQQFKRDSSSRATTNASKIIRKLDLVALNMVPSNAHLVLAPLPNANPTLQSAMNVLARIKHSPAGRPVVLYFADWTARVCGACDRDIKAQAAYGDVVVGALRALDPAVMGNVQVLRQSDAILADPSNYWISVINVGRHFRLQDVMGTMKDADPVGGVIARLMLVADVVGVGATTIALAADSDNARLEANLVLQFFAFQLPGVPVPHISFVSAPNLTLQPERESVALKTENDEYYVLDDPKVHGKAKMKKAFCEPGNISFCPPIRVAECFAFEAGGQLLVQRSLENGGDLVYEAAADVERDFASGSLHPGDLKAATAQLMVTVLDRLAVGLKADGAAAKATKTLKALQKKMAKAKK